MSLRGAGAVALGASLIAMLCPAPPARAASIVYADKGNVWVATPDGTVNRQFTTDGTEETPPGSDASQREKLVGPYHHPSADDSGRIMAMRNRYNAEGTHRSWFWKFMAPDGTHVASNIVSMYQCGSATGPLGPFDARVDRAGGLVAFSFYCNGRMVGLNPTTTWLQDAPEWSPFESPGWVDNRLIASRSGVSYVQDASPQGPLTDSWSPWVSDDSGSIGRVDVARAGGKLLVEVTVGETRRLEFGTYSGGIPDSTDGQTKCTLATAADPESASWSPDGTMVAWQDAGGVKVAPAPDLSSPQNAAGQTCVLPAAPRVLSATGSHPVFTAYTYAKAAPEAGGGGGGQPGGGSGPGGGAPGKLAGTLPPALKASALAKGVRLSVKTPGAGRLAAKATVPAAVARRLGLKARGKGRVIVASGRATVSAAGSAKVALRLAAKARRRAARLRGKRLTIQIAFTPASGSPSLLTRSVKVR
jgi:hypothetical protein